MFGVSFATSFFFSLLSFGFFCFCEGCLLFSGFSSSFFSGSEFDTESTSQSGSVSHGVVLVVRGVSETSSFVSCTRFSSVSPSGVRVSSERIFSSDVGISASEISSGIFEVSDTFEVSDLSGFLVTSGIASGSVSDGVLSQSGTLPFSTGRGSISIGSSDCDFVSELSVRVVVSGNVVALSCGLSQSGIFACSSGRRGVHRLFSHSGDVVVAIDGTS